MKVDVADRFDACVIVFGNRISPLSAGLMRLDRSAFIISIFKIFSLKDFGIVLLQVVKEWMLLVGLAIVVCWRKSF